MARRVNRVGKANSTVQYYLGQITGYHLGDSPHMVAAIAKDLKQAYRELDVAQAMAQQ
jgi:hypothetical protein